MKKDEADVMVEGIPVFGATNAPGLRNIILGCKMEDALKAAGFNVKLDKATDGGRWEFVEDTVSVTT